MTDLTDLENTLTALLEGKHVVSAAEDGTVLVLDDGMTLHLYESDAECCARAFGKWTVARSAPAEAVVTKVSVTQLGREDEMYTSTHTATLTVLHNNNVVAMGECQADDGDSGCYFSVLSLRVLLGEATLLDTEVLRA